MAQRMESVASPGDVMLSESTARLVENAVGLWVKPEQVHIKNVDAPVRAQRLFGFLRANIEPSHRSESKLVGGTWELNTVTGILEEAINRRRGMCRQHRRWGRPGVREEPPGPRNHRYRRWPFCAGVHQPLSCREPCWRKRSSGGGVIFGPMATSVLCRGLAAAGEWSRNVQEAQSAIDRMSAVEIESGLVLYDIWTLRMRALLAQAQGEDAMYREYRDRYRKMAQELGFEAHVARAEAMD